MEFDFFGEPFEELVELGLGGDSAGGDEGGEGGAQVGQAVAAGEDRKQHVALRLGLPPSPLSDCLHRSAAGLVLVVVLDDAEDVGGNQLFPLVSTEELRSEATQHQV